MLHNKPNNMMSPFSFYESLSYNVNLGGNAVCLKQKNYLGGGDTVNEQQMKEGKEGFAFDHDCREGICGMCSLVINGMPHGPDNHVTTCQLFMRKFKDGDTIVIEPWRASAFPVIRDCVVNRSAFDRIIQAGGFVSINTGSAPDAVTIPVPKSDADSAFDAAACIGVSACVVVCQHPFG